MLKVTISSLKASLIKRLPNHSEIATLAAPPTTLLLTNLLLSRYWNADFLSRYNLNMGSTSQPPSPYTVTVTVYSGSHRLPIHKKQSLNYQSQKTAHTPRVCHHPQTIRIRTTPKFGIMKKTHSMMLVVSVHSWEHLLLSLLSRGSTLWNFVSIFWHQNWPNLCCIECCDWWRGLNGGLWLVDFPWVGVAYFDGQWPGANGQLIALMGVCFYVVTNGFCHKCLTLTNGFLS